MTCREQSMKTLARQTSSPPPPFLKARGLCFGKWRKILLLRKTWGRFRLCPTEPRFSGKPTFFLGRFYRICRERQRGRLGGGGREEGKMLGNPETSRVNAKGAAQTPGRERGTASMRSPAPTPRLGGGEVGHKGCARPPLRRRGGQRPHFRGQPRRTPPQPSPGKV